jgi:hypothetical protein
MPIPFAPKHKQHTYLGIALIAWLAAIAANWRPIAQAVFVLRNHEPLPSLIAITALVVAPFLALVAFLLPRFALSTLIAVTVIGLVATATLPEVDTSAILYAGVRYYAPNLLVAALLVLSARFATQGSVATSGRKGTEHPGA